MKKTILILIAITYSSISSADALTQSQVCRSAHEHLVLLKFKESYKLQSEILFDKSQGSLNRGKVKVTLTKEDRKKRREKLQESLSSFKNTDICNSKDFNDGLESNLVSIRNEAKSGVKLSDFGSFGVTESGTCESIGLNKEELDTLQSTVAEKFCLELNGGDSKKCKKVTQIFQPKLFSKLEKQSSVKAACKSMLEALGNAKKYYSK